MRALLIAAALAAFVPTEAHATSWYRIGGNDETMSYVDLDSLSVVGGKTTAVTQSVYSEPVDGDIYSAAIKSEYDCAGGYFRTLEYTYYGQDGAFIATEPSATPDEHKVPVTESLNESMMQFVCQRTGGEAVGNIYTDAAYQFSID